MGGVVDPKPASMVDGSTPIDLIGERPRYLSRGGDKLEAALRTFAIDVAGRRALDVGASTGGFTDCLLQHGATSVTALYVGRGQLAWTLRSDPRVEVREGINVRHVDPGDLAAPYDVIAVDVSFISLRTIAEALISLGTARTDYVLLVKPQFEAGREEVPKGGIVRDGEVHRAVLDRVVSELAARGLGIVALMASPVLGSKGNREFLAHARLGEEPVPAEALAEVVT